MNIEEAKTLLNACVREELRDHAFGDREVFWASPDGTEVASGYFGSGASSVSVGDSGFSGDDAYTLGECGTLGHVERNDETGPDDFTQGDVMPGLSLGDVFHELTGSYLDERE